MQDRGFCRACAAQNAAEWAAWKEEETNNTAQAKAAAAKPLLPLLPEKEIETDRDVEQAEPAAEPSRYVFSGSDTEPESDSPETIRQRVIAAMQALPPVPVRPPRRGPVGLRITNVNLHAPLPARKAKNLSPRRE